MDKIIKKTKHCAAGFSLLEVVVVLFIMAVALVGVLNLAIDSSRAQTSNRNLLIAQQLAREGLELVTNYRDNNWLANVAWNNNLTGTPGGTDYIIDPFQYTPTLMNSASDAQLRILPIGSSGHDLYFHSASTNYVLTPFSRKITVEAADAISPTSTVKSLVQWTDHGNTYNYELETNLYDWH